jgi:hypothetical protein
MSHAYRILDIEELEVMVTRIAGKLSPEVYIPGTEHNFAVIME